jgi:diguanylate cyclase (GGDEF)-like protein
MKPIESSVNRKIISLIIFAVVMNILVVGTFGLFLGSKQLDDENVDKLRYKTESFISKFENDILEVRKTVSVLETEMINTFDIEKFNNSVYLNDFVESLDSLTYNLAQNSDQSHTAYVYINPFIVGETFDVYYVDDNGDGVVERQKTIPIEYYQEGPTETDSKSWFFGPIKNNEGFWSEPYYWKVDSGKEIKYISYTVPIIVDDKFIAIVGTDMRFDLMEKTVSDFNEFDNSFAFLLNENYEKVVYQDENTYDSLVGELSNKEDISDNIFSIRYKNRFNQKSIAIIGQLSNGWYFGINYLESDITSTLYEYTFTMIGFMILILVISLIVSLRVAKVITDPILRIINDVDSVDLLSITFEEDLLLREDEIGLLANTIKDMSDQIKDDIFELRNQNSLLNNEISKRKNAETKSDLFIKMLSQSKEGLFILDEDLMFLYTNDAYLSITSCGVAVGKEIEDCGIEISDYMKEEIDQYGHLQTEFELTNDRNETFVVQLILNKIRDTRVLYFGILRDVTNETNDKRRLFKLGNFDKLTSMPNSTYFSKLIQDKINENRESPFLLLLCNIDKFRMLNGVLGVQLSDKLLQEFSKRLDEVSGEDSIVGRVDGDEFAIFIRKNEESVDRIKYIFESMMEKYQIGEEQIDITIGMGISEFPSDASELNRLMQLSKNALNAAKNDDGVRYLFYSDSIGQNTEEEYSLLKNLRYAIARNELSMVYQPQIDVRKRKVVGIEALMRWNLNGEMISPERFIPLAEEYNLIHSLGTWALEDAIKYGSKLFKLGLKLTVAVNISGLQIKDDSFVTIIDQLVKKYSFPFEYLELEITESVLVGKDDSISDKIQSLREKGVKFSIDDFGTGYSSLSYLHKYDFDKIKIDRTFIMDYPTGNDGKIVNLIIKLAESIGASIIAEGVETDVQADYLISRDCHLMQGNMYSKPLSKENLIEFVELTNKKS